MITNPQTMLFEATSPNARLLINAKTLYSAESKADVSEVIMGNGYIRVTINQSTSLFDNGITAIYSTQYIAMPIDYNYRDINYHTYPLGDIPYIWGTYDKEKSWNNQAVQVGEDGIITASQQLSSNYILLTINNTVTEEKSSGNLKLTGTNGNIILYTFSLKPKQQRYMFRVSSDWWWNCGTDLIVEVDTDADIKVLLGD
jgi:hypothetical protein